jgi:sulfate adenylyltransferase large subunit
MKIVIAGNVDHGKSTLIGRLLYDTNSLPEGVFEEVERISKELGKEVEFAYIIDSLEEEREQNVTIDTSQIFFKSSKREYTIIDAPGHKEFLKNMITGASSADAAILIVSASEGVQEQTKRHAYIIDMLGLKQLIVVINKMDAIGYDKSKFDGLKEEILEFLGKLNIKPEHIIPISALKGDNIAKKSEKMSWYAGLHVIEALDSLRVKESPANKSLRFPIQDAYKVDGKKIFVGRIETGKLKKGEDVIFLPSNRRSKIRSIEVWDKNKTEAEAGESIGVTLMDALLIERGEILCSGNLPKISEELEANIFWMSKVPGHVSEKLILKCATQETTCKLEKIKERIDSSTLDILGHDCTEVREAEVGKVILKTDKPLVMENFNDVEEMGRFVLVKDDSIVAGGIILR